MSSFYEMPDLESGFMILNHDTPNRWQTRIESVLVRKGSDHGSEYSYLSHECRSENVGEDPFGHADALFVGISTWAGNFFLGSGSSLLRKNKKFNPRETQNKFLVSCASRSIKYLDFDDVLTYLQRDCDFNYEPIYTEIEFCINDHCYIVYTPCRYLNFPSSLESSERYLQPISGYILVESQERFFLGYVVSHIVDGETKTVQFRVIDQLNYFDTIGGLGWLGSLCKKIMPVKFYSEGYTPVIGVDQTRIKCRFYRYAS